MSSIPLALRQASGKAQAQFKREQYLRNLRLQSKLAAQSLEKNRTYAKMKSLGVPNIQPMKLQEYKSADQLFADSSAQLKIALENARKFLPLGDDASTFVQALDTNPLPNGANELQLFNRYFTKFEKNVKETVDIRSITAAYLKQLWTNWTAVIPYFENDKANKGIPIDFRDPASRVIAGQDLLNKAEVLKNRISATSSLTLPKINSLKSKVDDALLFMDKSVLDEVERQLNSIGGIKSIPAPTTAPASAIKAPKPTSTPLNSTQYVDVVEAILGVIINPRTSSEVYKALYQRLNKASGRDREELIDELVDLANRTFAAVTGAKLSSDASLRAMIRHTIMMSILAHLDTQGDFKMNDGTAITDIATAVKTENSPTDIANKIYAEIYPPTPISSTLTSPTSGGPSLGTATVSTTAPAPPPTPSTPAPKPAASKPATSWKSFLTGTKSGLGPTMAPTPALGSSSFVLPSPAPATKTSKTKVPRPSSYGHGISKKQRATILAGEIQAGNNNPTLPKKLFKVRNFPR